MNGRSQTPQTIRMNSVLELNIGPNLTRWGGGGGGTKNMERDAQFALIEYNWK